MLYSLVQRYTVSILCPTLRRKIKIRKKFLFVFDIIIYFFKVKLNNIKIIFFKFYYSLDNIVMLKWKDKTILLSPFYVSIFLQLQLYFNSNEKQNISPKPA